MKTLYEVNSNGAPLPITERVKTFEDACKVLGIDKVQLGIVGLDEDEESVSAYIKLVIIIRALNEGWKPDWTNENQYKYYPWFKHKSGFGLACDGCGAWSADAAVGSRLCLKSRELAEYVGTQFADIYNDYLSIKN